MPVDTVAMILETRGDCEYTLSDRSKACGKHGARPHLAAPEGKRCALSQTLALIPDSALSCSRKPPSLLLLLCTGSARIWRKAPAPSFRRGARRIRAEVGKGGSDGRRASGASWRPLRGCRRARSRYQWQSRVRQAWNVTTSAIADATAIPSIWALPGCTRAQPGGRANQAIFGNQRVHLHTIRALCCNKYWSMLERFWSV